jgi:HSP20 family molecular chaperone IbpA
MRSLREALTELPDAVFADLLESEDAYMLVLDLPGATGQTTELSVTDDRLSIEARREKDVPAEFRYRRENRSLFLDAELPLPPDVAGDEADASMERGVLELRLPKRGSEQEQRIEIE